MDCIGIMQYQAKKKLQHLHFHLNDNSCKTPDNETGQSPKV